MAEMEYKDGIIAYEVFGEGPPIIFTGGGYFRRNEWAYLNAGRLWATNKVIIWDRPLGNGESTVIDTDTETVFHLWKEVISGTAETGFLSTWVAESTAYNPEYRERFCETKPAAFADLMKRSGDYTMSDRFFASGLSDDELEGITCPALVAPGPNDLHPRAIAERLFKLLPNAEWVEYADRWGDNLDQMLEEPHTIAANEIKRYMPFLLDWLKRLGE